MIKAIIFDFDGVLVDSVNIKTEAFADLYREYGDDIVNKAVEHHLINGGISRYKKIEYYHREFLGISLSEEELEKLAVRFSSIVKDKVIKAPYIDGAEEFLNENFKKYKMFVCSGTPETEIKEIITGRGMDEYFKIVYGSPETKANIINYILLQNSFNKNEVVFLGDSINDYDAAVSADVPFIGVTKQENTFPGNVNVIPDLNGLPRDPIFAD